jgi:hypothetical protein
MKICDTKDSGMEGMAKRFIDYININQNLIRKLIDAANKGKFDICSIRIPVDQLELVVKQINEDYNANIIFPTLFITLGEIEQAVGRDHSAAKVARKVKENGMKGLVIALNVPIPDNYPKVMQSVFVIYEAQHKIINPPKDGTVMKKRKRMIKNAKQSLRINGMTDEMIKNVLGAHFTEFLETGTSLCLCVDAPNGVTVLVAMNENDE